ncbi:MAG: diphosphomevalonate decarboxylase, partial [Anaerolineae bacterium]|nr:diphosphomevalonate decarboxylase [Anaerolineae bacterium]
SPSISFNLAELFTRTSVIWEPDVTADQVVINGQLVFGPALERVSHHLDHIRRLADHSGFARVTSTNNFPTGAGIASSASAFAALSLAATAALGLSLSEQELSTLARLGSGSASRSIPGGFVAWYAGDDHASSFAESIAPPDHWDLADLIAVVSQVHKTTGSTAGHRLAPTSPLQAARIATAQERFDRCQHAIMQRDFSALAAIVELDNNIMHGVMMTSTPPLLYWEPMTLHLIKLVRQWREEDGIEVCYTIDAGPNVHCICTAQAAEEVERRLRGLSGLLELRRATPGGGAHLV